MVCTIYGVRSTICSLSMSTISHHFLLRTDPNSSFILMTYYYLVPFPIPVTITTLKRYKYVTLQLQLCLYTGVPSPRSSPLLLQPSCRCLIGSLKGCQHCRSSPQPVLHSELVWLKEEAPQDQSPIVLFDPVQPLQCLVVSLDDEWPPQ